jgi:hypothetical protein
MMNRIEYFELKYPVGYNPFKDKYKKTYLGHSYVSDLMLSMKGIDTMLWKRGARLKITGRMTDFRLYELGDSEPWMSGTI